MCPSWRALRGFTDDSAPFAALLCSVQAWRPTLQPRSERPRRTVNDEAVVSYTTCELYPSFNKPAQQPPRAQATLAPARG